MKRLSTTWMLCLSLAGCPEGTITGPGNDLAAPPLPDTAIFNGPYSDFPAGPQVDPVLPKGIEDQFKLPAQGTLAAPCLTEPTLDAMYPRNFSPPLFEWVGAPQANVFELRLHIENQVNDLLIYTPANRYQMPLDLWQSLSFHSAGQDIVVSVRAAAQVAGKLTSGPSPVQGGPVHIAPVEARGAVVYWTTSNGSALKGFRIGAAQSRLLIDPPTINDGSKCVGCHVSSPDGQLAFLSRSADADGNLPFSVDARRVDGSAGPAPLDLFSPVAQRLLQRTNQTLPTLSRAHYAPGDAVVLTMFYDEVLTQGKWELAFTDLLAQKEEGASGILARGGDGRQPANPAWSQDGKTIAYVATSGRVTDGRVRDGVADIFTIPYNDRKGGAATPLPGASDPLFNEYYPTFSPEDRLVAFNRVAAGLNMYNAPTAEVMVVAAKGGTAVRLLANDPPACTGQQSPGLTNSWPRWAPFIGQVGDRRYYWLVFSSKRRGGYPQLYVAAVVTSTDQARGEVIERTYPAVYVTSQNPLESNHTPAWDDFKIVVQ